MAQGKVTQKTGHAYTLPTGSTALKYRTKNAGNPLAHNDVDANFEILRSALNGVIDDIVGVAGNTVSTNVPVNAVFTDTQLTTDQVRGKFSAGTNVAISGGVISSTNTTYSVGDGGLTEKNFTGTLLTKLNAVATSANNYSLPVAATAIGGVKEGGDIDIDGDGNMTVKANVIGATEIADGSITGSQIAAGTITAAQVSGGQLGGGQEYWMNIKRFASGFVGNKYATSGHTIANTRAQILAGGAATINVGIGGPFGARDGNLTTGRYSLFVHYPGSGNSWYANNMSNVMKNQLLVSGFVAGAQTGHTEPDIYYTAGQGQSIPIQIGTGSHVHMRGDGKIDVHLMNGNTASWSYAVLAFCKWSDS